MNILQLCHKPPYPSKDGGSIATSVLTQGYADFGHRIHILAMNTPKHFTRIEDIHSLLPEKTTIWLIDTDTQVNLMQAVVNFIFSKKPYHVKRFYSKAFENRLSEILQQQTFDLIQLEGLYVVSYIPTLRKYSRSTICYRAHNIESEIWERIAESEKNKFKKIYLTNLAQRIRKFEAGIINSYDALLPITLRDADVFNSLGNVKPVCIVPVGIRIHPIPSGNLQTDVCMGYIGALDWIPNQQGLIWFMDQVWPLIQQQDKNIRMYIAGRNAPTWLEKRFHALHLDYLGEVEDAHHFMQQFAIMVVPLFSGSGMRVKIIEGLYLGKAIVATTIGAEGIQISHRKNILIADTCETFAADVLELSSNEDFRNEISKNAKEVVHDYYEIDQITQKLVKFIENL